MSRAKSQDYRIGLLIATARGELILFRHNGVPTREQSARITPNRAEATSMIGDSVLMPGNSEPLPDPPRWISFPFGGS